LVGIADRQRTDEDLIEQRENRRVRANAECQRDNGGRREHRAPSQLTHGEEDVARYCFQGFGSARHAHRRSLLARSTKVGTNR
jgi:hypothetical protein